MFKLPQWLTNSLIICSFLLWALCIIVNMLDHTYPVPASLTLIVSGIFSALVGNEYIFRRPREAAQQQDAGVKANDK